MCVSWKYSGVLCFPHISHKFPYVLMIRCFINGPKIYQDIFSHEYEVPQKEEFLLKQNGHTWILEIGSRTSEISFFFYIFKTKRFFFHCWFECSLFKCRFSSPFVFPWTTTTTTTTEVLEKNLLTSILNFVIEIARGLRSIALLCVSLRAISRDCRHTTALWLFVNLSFSLSLSPGTQIHKTHSLFLCVRFVVVGAYFFFLFFGRLEQYFYILDCGSVK